MSSSVSVDGLISGLNTSDIITKLMALERAPQDALKSQLATLQSRISAYQSINGKLSSLNDAAGALSTNTGWKLWSATSNAPTAFTATATSSANAGSLSFSIDRLATAGSLVSSGTLASTTAIAATSPVLVAKGGTAFGISTITGSGLTDGAHSVTVTQSTTAATLTGGTALGASTTITAANNTLSMTVDGVANTFTIAAGTYTQNDLATAVQTASGGKLTATVTNSGALQLASAREGSAHSIQITGGTAISSGVLGMTAGALATGTNGILKADNGATVTVTDAGPGATATLTSDTGGTIAAVLSGGLRVGTLAAKSVNVGDGSLDSTVSAINNANMGVVATSVQVAAGSYRLQLSSTTTGAASAINVGATAFSGIGTMNTLVQATDAQLTVGSGAGAYKVASATNTVSNLLPGVTLSLLTTSTTPVTVNVASDSSGIADKVQKMVDSLNAALSEMKTDTDYNVDSKKAGLLIGDGTITGLMRKLKQNVTDPVAGNPLGSLSAAGVTLSKDGTSFSFDKTVFLAAYANDPTSVKGLFSGSSGVTDPSVSVIADPSNKTMSSANWPVNVTALATTASASGAVIGSGKLNPAETISLRMGGTTVSYTSANNDTLASVAAGINAAISTGGITGLAASVVNGNQLVVSTTGTGSASTFDIMSTRTGSGLVSTASAWQTHTGTDVAGTVNGVAFTGSGSLLSAPAGNTTFAGMVIKVTSTTLGAHGSYTFNASAAQRLTATANQAIDPVTGNLSLLINGRQASVKTMNQQIADYDTRLALRQDTLKRQFASLETALGSLKDQGNYLAGQIAGLPTS